MALCLACSILALATNSRTNVSWTRSVFYILIFLWWEVLLILEKCIPLVRVQAASRRHPPGILDLKRDEAKTCNFSALRRYLVTSGEGLYLSTRLVLSVDGSLRSHRCICILPNDWLIHNPATFSVCLLPRREFRCNSWRENGGFETFRVPNTLTLLYR